MQQEVFAVVLQHKSLDILNSLAEGQPLVGRLSPQLLHHLPLLLNPSRHPLVEVNQAIK